MATAAGREGQRSALAKRCCLVDALVLAALDGDASARYLPAIARSLALHRLLPIAMAAALAIPIAEVRAATRADLKVIRFPGSVQLRLIGIGRNPDVRQFKQKTVG